MRPLKVALCPFGSQGDVNPLLWAAQALAERGHDPRILVTPHYGHLAEAAGIQWVPVGQKEEFERLVRDPKFWHPHLGAFHVGRAMLQTFPDFSEAWARLPWRPDLAIVTTLGFAAAFAAEAARVPLLMIHLQPAVLFSAHDLPVFNHGLAWLRRAPLPIRHAYGACVQATLRTLLLPRLNSFRQALGLPPWRHFLQEAILGAKAVGLFFPKAFAPSSPGEPIRIRHLGFPLPTTTPPLPTQVREFLDKYGPPVLWTHGSANYDTARFAQCAAATASTHPCLLVCPEPPAFPLPPRTLHLRHAPFETLFPLCRAIVHHGGIGTVAQALAARRPQLIIPRAHDQPDNAERVARIGKGHVLSYLRLSPISAVVALRKLLETFPRELTEMEGLRACPRDFSGWAEEIGPAGAQKSNF